MPQIRPKVIIRPLVRASGTGKVSSTVKVNATGLIGITVAPIKNIVTISTAGILEGNEKK